MSESDHKDVPAAPPGSLTYQFSSIDAIDEFLSVVEEVADDLDPTVTDRQWLKRAIRHLESSMAASLEGSRETLERAYFRLKSDIEAEESRSFAFSERVDAYRRAIVEIEGFLGELERVDEAPSQNEVHLLAVSLMERRAELVKQLKRYENSFFSPGPGVHEMGGWKRVIDRFAALVRHDEALLAQTTQKVSSLRRSLLIRSALLDSTTHQEFVTPIKHIEPVASAHLALSVDRSREHFIGELRSDLAVIEALRESGRAGLNSKEIVSYLRKTNHPLVRRQEPIKSVYNEISRLKRDQPGVVLVRRSGREVFYSLSASIAVKISEHPSSSPIVGLQELDTYAGPSIGEMIVSILRDSGARGYSVSGILEVLSQSKHKVMSKANPRSIVVYEIGKLKKRAAGLVCTKVGREVFYRLK